jgi:hypothetical protein
VLLHGTPLFRLLNVDRDFVSALTQRMAEIDRHGTRGALAAAVLDQPEAMSA